MFWSELPLLPHLQRLRAPDTADADAATAEMLQGLEFAEREAFLRLKATKLASIAELLHDRGRDDDYVRAVYRSDLLVFEWAVIEIAAASGDQHLATARVKMLLSQAALTIAMGQQRFSSPAAAIGKVRQVLLWSMMGARESLGWLTMPAQRNAAS